MRLYFVNRFYWPAEQATAQLLTDLAESLATAGWSVSIVTGVSSAGLPARTTHRGVEIIRVGPLTAGATRFAGRAWDFARFHAAAARCLRREARRGDIVVALTDPPLIGLTAALVAAARGTRLIHWIHDIYPEVLYSVAPNFSSRLLCRALRPPRNLAWRRAAACVTLGETMADVVRRAGVAAARLHVVPNWAPRGVAPVAAEARSARREQWDLNRRFVVGYSGNLGRVHDLAGLIEVAEILRDDPRFVFLFVGGGAGLHALREAAERRGLPNVRFEPPQPRAELSLTLSVPDIHVIAVRAGCESFVFPSKLYGAAAVARPALVLAAPGAEIARLVRAAGMGLAFAPNESAAIAAALRELAGDPARLEQFGAAAARFHAAGGNGDIAAQRWQALLAAVAGSDSPVSRPALSPSDAASAPHA